MTSGWVLLGVKWVEPPAEAPILHFDWFYILIDSIFWLILYFEPHLRETRISVSRQYCNAEHSERPFSTLETRSRISSFQSHASRRDREFLSLGLVLRDENENLILQSHVSRRERDFFSSVSCIESRTRIFTFSLILRDENFCLNSCTSRREREQCWGMASLIFSPVNN